MAKVGTTLARWVKETTDATGGRSRTHYALRKDGKLLRKDSIYETPTYSKPGWHDWGWTFTSRSGTWAASELDIILTPKGFTRED